ncbi:transposase [Stenotrophomonas sp. PUT21]|uniref:transposase n=1 Tax=unclassified Stenotrophomonas TaxID=196198 RepID=UPI003BA0D906
MAHYRRPLRTNLVEGINNKFKVTKRVAYGYRDDAHFLLRSGQPSPAPGEKSQKKRAEARFFLSANA